MPLFRAGKSSCGGRPGRILVFIPEEWHLKHPCGHQIMRPEEMGCRQNPAYDLSGQTQASVRPGVQGLMGDTVLPTSLVQAVQGNFLEGGALWPPTPAMLTHTHTPGPAICSLRPPHKVLCWHDFLFSCSPSLETNNKQNNQDPSMGGS